MFYKKTIFTFLFILSYKDSLANSEFKAKGLYLNFYSTVGKRFDNAMELIKKTQLNSLVIDIKNEYGEILYKSTDINKIMPQATKKTFYKELSTLVNKLKPYKTYNIARIVVFKDNLFASLFPKAAIKRINGSMFTKKDKMKWIDPHYKKYWNYIATIAKEVLVAGFDEVQFDYIRFPGSSSELVYKYRKGDIEKSDVIKNFITFIKEKLSIYKKPISVDVFGLVGNVADDLNIGQIWEKIAPQVDYMSPMIYPSHYPKGFAKIKDPDLEPYKTITKSLKRSIKRNNQLKKPAKIRPWIQGFTAKWLTEYKRYGHKQLSSQIKALEDVGIEEYLIWNPRSKYEVFFPLDNES